MRVTDPTTGREYFSKRRRRFDDDRMPRELTFSCFKGLPLLSRDRSRTWFIESLESARRHWAIDLWAYVIMPEHVHLLVAPREPGVKVGEFAGEIKEETSRSAMTWLEANNPQWLAKITVREGSKTRRRFWQPGGGYDRNITELDTLYASLTYIHMNPVRRGLVQKPEEWLWSSAPWYAGIRPALIEIDATLPSLGGTP